MRQRARSAGFGILTANSRPALPEEGAPVLRLQMHRRVEWRSKLENTRPLDEAMHTIEPPNVSPLMRDSVLIADLTLYDPVSFRTRLLHVKPARQGARKLHRKYFIMLTVITHIKKIKAQNAQSMLARAHLWDDSLLPYRL
jgi:hypothetical protein